jgi:hypothetical protein
MMYNESSDKSQFNGIYADVGTEKTIHFHIQTRLHIGILAAGEVK